MPLLQIFKTQAESLRQFCAVPVVSVIYKDFVVYAVDSDVLIEDYIAVRGAIRDSALISMRGDKE